MISATGEGGLAASEATEESPVGLRRVNSLRLPAPRLDQREGEPGTQLRRGGSLRVVRASERINDQNLLKVPSSTGLADAGGRPARPTRHSAPAIATPAPELLARSLLQLGCPAVSMPEPRSGVGSEHPQSSDSDDSLATHGGHHGGNRNSGHAQHAGQGPMDGGLQSLPKVQVSGPSNPVESSAHNGSAGSIGARSAPSTPLQGVVGTQGGQQSSQHNVATANNSLQSPPPRSPSHVALRCSDSQLSKPLSRSTPSMAAGSTQSQVVASRSSSRSSPTSISSARQKKFHRHFSQVAPDERVLNYYSCALVSDILLQGYLYITPNYFAFYSNVFGYVTKLLIPTVSVLKISKEKTARIIPNAVAVATEEERHVFCSFISRNSTFKLMKQVWDAALKPRAVENDVPLPVEARLLSPEVLLVDDSEANHEEDDSSMSESGTDRTSRAPTVCTDTDGLSAAISASIPRPSLPPTRLEQVTLAKSVPSTRPSSSSSLGSLFLWGGARPGTVIAVLVALLAALYVSAALMMMRIDRLHTAYLNHPLASPERFTQDRLLQYLNSNLDQIVKVRKSLQTLSQQFVTMTEDSEAGSAVSSGTMEPEDAPS